jgi:hypothetical protein
MYSATLVQQKARGPKLQSYMEIQYTGKKVINFPVPRGDVTYQTLPGRENFPARESLVSDIPAGDGKIANLFLQCKGFQEFEYRVAEENLTLPERC